MSEWTSQPLFGVALTVGTYALACRVRDRWQRGFNPLRSDTIVGTAFGTTSHGIGTARLLPDPRSGARSAGSPWLARRF